ncbi:MAG: class I SAM-dependent methyltransferase [bacterium]|nr:class I SAM-dependent methyltransferase [bacterium]
MKTLYRIRFPEEEWKWRDDVWRILCRRFFQRYVKPTDRLLDVGCGYCNFLRHIRCGEKYGVDVDDESVNFTPPGARVIIRDAVNLDCFQGDYFDVVFASNFFEHLETRSKVLESLGSIHKVLKSGGRLLILQPNMRAMGGKYWDFFDHYLPLTDRSMREALELAGFWTDELRPRFLPATTKRQPFQSPLLAHLYLRMRILHPIIGKQMFIVARKRVLE